MDSEVFGLNGFVVLKHDRYREDTVEDVAVGIAISPIPSQNISPGDRVLFPWDSEKYVITVGENRDYVAVPKDSLIMVVRGEVFGPHPEVEVEG